MTVYGKRIATLLLIAACAWFSGGCISPLPVGGHEVLSYTRDGLSHGYDFAESSPTLSVQWLGAACHSIRLGEASILTDPFVSYRGLGRVLLGKVEPDPWLVQRWTGHLPRPAAMFVGHSHYDHLLDLPEIRRQRGWQGVPIIGSETTRCLLASYGEGIEADQRPVEPDMDWTTLGPGVAYKAYRAEHAPQAPNLLFYPGYVNKPLTSRPVRAGDFRCGDTYAYLFKLGAPPTEFTVYFVGAASTPPLGLPKDDVGPVDVVILCVPGWKNVVDYPGEIIRRLKPRQIILSHFDDFFVEGRLYKSVVPSAALPAFIRETLKACDYREFERLCVPDVGAIVRVSKK